MQGAAHQRATISETIKERLSAEAVDSIEISDAIDHDGDPILKITIVVKDKINSLDRRRMIGLTRHIRRKLGDDTKFPVIEFITRQDAKKKREAA